MKSINLCITLFLIITFSSSNVVLGGGGSSILFYFALASPSHITSIWPVIEVLANSGHNVTVVASVKLDKLKNPRVNKIIVNEIDDILKHHWGEESNLIQTRLEGRVLEQWDVVLPVSLDVCRTFLQSPTTQTLIHNSKFDLVIVDSSYNECGMGLAHYQYKCPFILYSAFAMSPNYYDQYGFPSESSSISDMHHGFKLPLNFYAKLISTLRPITWGWYNYQYYYYPGLTQIFKDNLKLNDGVQPSFGQLTSKVSLVLLGSHYSNEHARTLPPLFVRVAGMGLNNETKPLPKELETFVSKPNTDGFIYISFGTTVPISKSNFEFRDKLYGAIRKFPSVQFVWKWGGDVLPSGDGIPTNIYFSNWLPQQDLLGHKKIKVFITHGGINGLHEATNYGVPMIVFPVWADQDYNANILEFKGLGIPMEITDFTQEILEVNIRTLLNDKEYHNRMKLASIAFRDRPMKPIDTAVWWIEYVLRTKDTSFLMPLSATQSWYEHRLLDVWAFVFTILISGLGLILFVLYKLSSILLFKSNNATKNENGVKRKTN